jgi:hypothetical protein
MYGNAAAPLMHSVLVFACCIFSVKASLLRKPAAQAAIVPTAKAQSKSVSVPQANNASDTRAPLVSKPTNITANSPEDPLQVELKAAEESVQSKDKQLKVQATLEKEKEHAAEQALNMTDLLKRRVDKLMKEADVAAEIAREKSRVAAKVEKLRNTSDLKAQHLLLEEKEMQRMLNQTKREEIDLEHNVSRIEHLIKQRDADKVQKKAKNDVASRTKANATVLLPVVPANVTKVITKDMASSPQGSLKMPVANSTMLTSALVSDNFTATNATLSNEAIKQLVEENSRLKQEKAVLLRRLNQRKLATEKAKLKQKLKNRLALADRHMKLRKKGLPPHH